MLKFNNRVLNYNTRWLANKESGPIDPYNPLGLPPFTIRCKFTSGYTPDMGDSQTLVDAGENVWDITNNGTGWNNLFEGQVNLLSVLGANTTGVVFMESLFSGCESMTSVALFDTSSVTTMSYMFGDCYLLASVPLFDTVNVEDMYAMFIACSSLSSVPLFNTSKVTSTSNMFAYCNSLTNVPLFDTSSVTNMSSMFAYTAIRTVPQFNTSSVISMYGMLEGCNELGSIPLFDTSSVEDVSNMFYECYNVQSGAFEIYQQMSTQANPPTNHYECFYNCGSNTVTGAAELAQIPSDWK